MRTTSRRILGFTLPIALLVAACSSGGGTTAAPTAVPASEAPASEAPASEAPASEAPASEAPAAGSVALADTALGTVLVDSAGRTLYGFTVDVDGVPACYDTCAQNWPPATGDAIAGDGLDGSLLTTVDRTDGSSQLKYGDWPLYTFAGDTGPGDTNGQGLNDKWFVIGADGALIGQS